MGDFCAVFRRRCQVPSRLLTIWRNSNSIKSISRSSSAFRPGGSGRPSPVRSASSRTPRKQTLDAVPCRTPSLAKRHPLCGAVEGKGVSRQGRGHQIGTGGRHQSVRPAVASQHRTRAFTSLAQRPFACGTRPIRRRLGVITPPTCICPRPDATAINGALDLYDTPVSNRSRILRENEWSHLDSQANPHQLPY